MLGSWVVDTVAVAGALCGRYLAQLKHLQVEVDIDDRICPEVVVSRDDARLRKLHEFDYAVGKIDRDVIIVDARVGRIVRPVEAPTSGATISAVTWCWRRILVGAGASAANTAARGVV